MKARLSLLALAAVASTAALCNPSTPAPAPVALRPISVHTGVPASMVWLDGANVPAAYATPVVADSTGAAGFAALPATATTINIHATAAGYAQYGAVAPAPGSGSVVYCFGGCDAATVAAYPTTEGEPAWAPVVQPPSYPALPPVPTRGQLTHARACFQGLTVTTAQLGSVPSFGGVETGMLSDAADRKATYNAILAAGCNEIILDVYCHYTEAGVAYPNQTACSNDWTTDNNATLVSRTAEAVHAGLYVLLMQGCDELAFTTCASQTAGQFAALRAYGGGDLTPFVALCPGFDSIVPIGNAPPAAASNQAMVSLLLNDRAVIGNGVLELELPTGWSFAGDGALSGAGWFTSPGGQAVDVYLQEFANVSPGNGPPPSVTGEFWNAPDSLYSPTWSGDSSPWDAVWQISARTVTHYSASPDQPFNVSVTATDGPQAGQLVTVSDDRQHITPNTFGGNPRGPFIVVAAEMSTYQWTHGQTTTAAVLADCSYVGATGYDVTWCPSPSSTRVAHVTVH